MCLLTICRSLSYDFGLPSWVMPSFYREYDNLNCTLSLICAEYKASFITSVKRWPCPFMATSQSLFKAIKLSPFSLTARRCSRSKISPSEARNKGISAAAFRKNGTADITLSTVLDDIFLRYDKNEDGLLNAEELHPCIEEYTAHAASGTFLYSSWKLQRVYSFITASE